MHLSVPKGAYISVVGGDMKVTPQLIQDLADATHAVYDFWGNLRQITIKDGGQEKALVTQAISGEMLVFGESHSVLCREVESVRYKRRLLTDVDQAIMVRLPQRKTTPLAGIYDLMDLDDRGIFMTPPDGASILQVMRKAAWGGCTVNRFKAELRIDIDHNRPACYATKYFGGSFLENLEETLEGLIAGNVITMSRPFDELLEAVSKSGVIFEGFAPVLDIPIAQPRAIEKDIPVYHIELDDQSTPVELPWCHC